MKSEISKKISFGVGAIVLSLILSLAGLELFLTIFSSNTLHGLYRSHPTRRYQHIPFANNGTYQINSRGLRDYEYSYEKTDDAFRIICLGDSITFGQGVKLEDTYVKQLELLLRQKYPRTEVVNFGVSGYNTVMETRFLEEEALRYNPDVAILQYCYNDSQKNYPLTPSENPYLNKLKDYLRKMRTYEFLAERWYRLAYRLKGLSDFNPEARIKDLQYSFSDAYNGWVENKKAFQTIYKLSQREHFQFLIVIFPKMENLGEDYPYKFFHQKVKQALEGKAEVLDLYESYKGLDAQELWVSSSDSHPNKLSHFIAAQAIYPVVAKYILRKAKCHK